MIFLSLCFLFVQTINAARDVEYYMAYYNNTAGTESRRVRAGSATNTHSCGHVRSVPYDVRRALGLSTFYQKYTEAYGIPVLSSRKVSNAAVQRACYVVRFLFADLYNVRNEYYKRKGRVAIMGKTERTTEMPEYSYLPSAYWDERARGLGGTPESPVPLCAEENALCFGRDKDGWYGEDIVLHEFAHGMHLVGVNFAVRDFPHRLTRAYNNAKSSGLWKGTYAISLEIEYFAEGVISYFNDNNEGLELLKNHVDTRAELRSYDPQLYKLISSLFPCYNQFLLRCHDKSQARSLRQRLKLNYPACTLEG